MKYFSLILLSLTLIWLNLMSYNYELTIFSGLTLRYVHSLKTHLVTRFH